MEKEVLIPSPRGSSGGAIRTPLFGISISEARVLVYGGYCLALAASFPLAAGSLEDPGFLTSLVLAYALGALIPLSIVFGRHLDLVEPLYWFSAMYYLIFPGTIYFLLTGFSTSEYLLNPGLPRLHRLTEQALMLFIVGYASFLAGYLALMRERDQRRLELPDRRLVSGWIIRCAIAICVLAGIANFGYLAIRYPGGPIGYLLDFGMRAYRYELIEGPVTTAGYQLLYAGIFLWFMVLVRDHEFSRRTPETWMFRAFMLVSVVVSVSQGKMGQTVTYILMLGFLTYVCSPGRATNNRFVLLAGFGVLLGVILYFLRRVSVATYGSSEEITLTALWNYANAFLPTMGYWLIDRGNTPNLTIVVNLLDQNGIAGELWYGRSLAAWVTNFSTTLGQTPNIARTVGALWFARDGGLPPTIVGEMFVNFGILGVAPALFVTGLMCSWFYNFVRSRADFVWYVIYLSVLFKFIFLWPKGEMTNVVAAFWQFMPTLAVFACVRLLSGADLSPQRPECAGRTS